MPNQVVNIRAPVRMMSDGNIQFTTLAKDCQKDWKSKVGSIFPQNQPGYQKPPRYVDFDLTHPLLIRPLQTRRKMIKKRFDSFQTLFDYCIDDVNEASRKKVGGKKWTLEYTENDPAQNNQYMLVSISIYRKLLAKKIRLKFH